MTGEFLSHQPPPLLIIDEAQNLTVDVLEEVRLLTNLEDPKAKMLQVLLAGQPELEEKLLRSDLRQLRQRIAVSARLEPLSLGETAAYIDVSPRARRLHRPRISSRGRRWRPSGRHRRDRPAPSTCLCDHSLVNAFAMGRREVEGTAAREAIQDVLFLQLRDRSVRKPGPYLVTHLEERNGDNHEEDPDTVGGGERRDRVG